MSAIGSVIVMAWWPSSPRFPLQGFRGHGLRPGAHHGTFGVVGGCFRTQVVVIYRCHLLSWATRSSRAARCHLAEAHAAQPEPAVHSTRAPAAGAPGVGTDFELGLPLRLRDQRLLRHGQLSLNGNPSRRSSERPSSSLGALVTTVMSIPRCLST